MRFLTILFLMMTVVPLEVTASENKAPQFFCSIDYFIKDNTDNIEVCDTKFTRTCVIPGKEYKSSPGFNGNQHIRIYSLDQHIRIDFFDLLEQDRINRLMNIKFERISMSELPSPVHRYYIHKNAVGNLFYLEFPMLKGNQNVEKIDYIHTIIKCKI